MLSRANEKMSDFLKKRFDFVAVQLFQNYRDRDARIAVVIG